MKRGRKQPADDDEWTPDSEKSSKGKKARKQKQPLTPPKKRKAKTAAKGLVAQNPVVITTTARLRRLNSLQAYSTLEVITAGVYEQFDDPANSPADGRGCKKATITLGPKRSFGQFGTDAAGVLPNALADAKIAYPRYSFKSGHVINADFGGLGSDPSNMTILTSSANSSQRAFDNAIKSARDYLHKAYQQMRLGNPTSQQQFFDDLGYGVRVVITMSDRTWADEKGLQNSDYPDNCISAEMALVATVVDAPSEAFLVGELTDSQKVPIIKKIKSYMAKVEELVDDANQRHTVDNRP